MNDTDAHEPARPTSESALGTVRGLVEEHPVAMLAGGILLGALVAGVLSRPAKTTSGEKPRRSFGRRAVQLAAIGAELAAAYVAGADSVVEDVAEPAQPSAPTAPEPPKSSAQRLRGLATSALRTFGPVLTQRLVRKTPD